MYSIYYLSIIQAYLTCNTNIAYGYQDVSMRSLLAATNDEVKFSCWKKPETETSTADCLWKSDVDTLADTAYERQHQVINTQEKCQQRCEKICCIDQVCPRTDADKSIFEHHWHDAIENNEWASYGCKESRMKLQSDIKTPQDCELRKQQFVQHDTDDTKYSKVGCCYKETNIITNCKLKTYCECGSYYLYGAYVQFDENLTTQADCEAPCIADRMARYGW